MMYCPLIRGKCKDKECVAYHVDAEFHCLVFAVLYRILMGD